MNGEIIGLAQGEETSLVNVRRSGKHNMETFAFRVKGGHRFSIGSAVEVKGENCFYTPKSNKSRGGKAGVDFDILYPVTQQPHAFGEYMDYPQAK